MFRCQELRHFLGHRTYGAKTRTTPGKTGQLVTLPLGDTRRNRTIRQFYSKSEKAQLRREDRASAYSLHLSHSAVSILVRTHSMDIN